MSGGYLGIFDSRNSQSVPAVDTPTAMYFDHTYDSRGISITSDQSSLPSLITFGHSGTYNIQFSAQLYYSGGGGNGSLVDIWLRHNGQDVEYTDTQMTVPSNSPYGVAAWNFMVSANAGDTFQIFWATQNTHITMPASPATVHTGVNTLTRPGVPSIILTVNQVSS